MLTAEQTQSTCKPWQRRLAWTLIAALANPATVLPLSLYSAAASARDTDIYLSAVYASSTDKPAEPAVLLILDTSDSMNVPEAWREYGDNGGAYDSHVEYLWNDPTFIDNISTAAAPVLTIHGSWAGATPEERANLQTTAKAYANGTETGDPGARSLYRNYNDANWVFWLPAGTDETDKRLWSNAFNRWKGGVKQSGVPANRRGGIDYGATDDFRSYNKCNDSLENLLPSTVFAPTSYQTNAGKYLSSKDLPRKWQRWEPFLDLSNISGTAYPTTLGKTMVPSSGTRSILAGVGVGSSIAARSEFLGSSSNVKPATDPVRDSYAWITPFPNHSDVGGQGQPIRTRLDNSRSGWADLAADMGGFNFQGFVNGLDATQLKEVLKLYNIESSISPDTTKHKAWKGNRDDTTAPAFGTKTGTPAYYDSPESLLGLSDGKGSTVCTRSCTIDGDSVHLAANSGNPPLDGDNLPLMYWVMPNASCKDAGVTGSDCKTKAPDACGAPSPAARNFYKPANYFGCAWSDRQSVVVEGTGTYYYGGTCSGSCRGEGGILGANACPKGETSDTYCTKSATDVTIGATVYRQATLNNGGNGSNFACTDLGDSFATCEQHENSKGCFYVASTKPCSDRLVDGPSGQNDYYVYPFAAGQDYLEHDCKADNGTSGNPGSGYLTDKARDFATPWNSVSDAAGTTAAYTPINPDTTPDTTLLVDMYSVNYLNWKFGPKSNGAPIGRKTRLQIAKDAVTSLVTKTNDVRFGLMVYNKLPADAGVRGREGSQGGNVAYAIHPMGSDKGDPDYGNRAKLSSAVNGAVGTGTTPLTEVMYEAYLYFRGEAPLFGTNTTAAASGGTVSDGRDAAAVKDGKYDSPMLSNPNSTSPALCQKNYVILVSDGGPESDNQAPLDNLNKALTQGPPFRTSLLSTQQATTSSSKQFETGDKPYGTTDLAYPDNYIWLDELTYFMANGDMSPGGASDADKLQGTQSVSTYTIGFAGGSSAVLENAAVRGNGKYFQAEKSSELAVALEKAVNSIRDWNPTATAPTVPLSSSNRSESADDVYLAFFGPKLQQRWDGTVKKFKLSTDGKECGVPSSLCLTGQTILDSKTGLKNIEQAGTAEEPAKVRDDAVSLWSSTTPPDGPDGGKPDMGGTGYVLKTASGSTPDSRQLYTHLSTSSQNDLTDAANAMTAANATITAALLNTDDGKRAQVINFGRGGPASDTSPWRLWPHADVLHSSPAILTYESNAIYLFYMSNDGILHAVDTVTGQEKWAFMPEEALPQLSALMDNTVGEHLIAGDGSPRIFTEDVDGDGRIATAGTDKAYLVFGLRRGGRAVYALDVSDRARPKFMWKVDPTTSGFAELGETWSAPAFARLRVTTDPVLVFGGGYDPVPNDQLTVSLNRFQNDNVVTVNTPVDHGYASGESVQISGATQSEYNGADKTIIVTGARSFTYTITGSPVTPATGAVKAVNNRAAKMGRGVFFVNASTGALIRSFTPADTAGNNVQVAEMIYSIPSDAVPINTDLDSGGYADRLYMGDLGGNVWRFDIDGSKPADWKAIKFADLTNGATPRRKILFPPAVVKQYYLGDRFDAVYVGTGDRENPLRTDNEDLMFMVKDRDVGLATSQTTAIIYDPDPNKSLFYDLTANLVQTGTEDEKKAALTALADKDKKGWVLKLRVDDKPGEKVVNSPRVFFNVLRFGTYSPSATTSVCLPPGKGTLYAVNALNGGYAVDSNFDGKHDPRTFHSLLIRGYPSDGTIVIRDGKVWDMSGGGSGALNIEKIGKAGVGQRAYWFQEPEQ